MLNNRYRKILAVLMMIALMTVFSACGDNNFSADEDAVTQDTVQQTEAVPEIEEPVIPEDKGETRQTVKVKADQDGSPVSASLKTEVDDMEEKIDPDKLPFKVRVSYWLDGKEITAKELAGKTGNVKIRFDYENMTDSKVDLGEKEISTKVPFAFVSLITMPEDRFYNAEVNNGGVTEASGNRLIYGFAMPGVKDELKLEAAEEKLKSLGEGGYSEKLDIPEYVEITGYAVNFKMDFTATLVTNGLLKDLKNSDLDDLRDMLSDLGEFSDAGDEMVNGVSKLKEGADKFGDALEQYTDGATQLKEGMGPLKKGADQFKDGTASLNEGAENLSEGAEALNSGSPAIKEEASSLKQGLEELAEAMESGTDLSGLNKDEVQKEAASSAEASVLEVLEGNDNLTEEEKSAIAKAAGKTAAEKATDKAADVVSNNNKENAICIRDAIRQPSPL